MDFTFNNRVPVSVRIWAVPFAWEDHAVEKALYVQDQWTIDRLTLNLGVRYNDVFQELDEATLAAGPFVGERTLPRVPNFPHWRNLNPRLGGAYDLSRHGQDGRQGGARPIQPADPGDRTGATPAQPVAEHQPHLERQLLRCGRPTHAATSVPTATCSIPCPTASAWGRGRTATSDRT